MKNRKTRTKLIRSSWIMASVSALLISGCQSPESKNSTTSTKDWETIHEETFLADLHNDAIYSISLLQGGDISHRNELGETDLDRLKEGGVDLQVFVLFSDGSYGPGTAFAIANRMADSLDSVLERNPDRVALARNYKDVEAIRAQDKLVALMAVEGGHMLEDRIDYIDSLYQRGMTYLTLTWNNSTSWATSAADEVIAPEGATNLGLKGIGPQVIQRLNELGVMIDLSHAGEQTFYDVLEVTTKPVMATHSNAYALVPHPRNLKDDQIRAIRDNGGLIGLNFYAGFIDPDFQAKKEKLIAKYPAEYHAFLEKAKGNVLRAERGLILSLPVEEIDGLRPPLAMLLDHLDHIVNLAGIDHVAIGSDFDGAEAYPEGIFDVSDFPKLTEALLERGYSASDIKKLYGENFIRIFTANNPG